MVWTPFISLKFSSYLHSTGGIKVKWVGEYPDCRAKRQHQQVDADAERNRVVQEQEERIRALEAELVHTREELEEERGTHRMEDLERADQEHAENNE